MIFVLWLLLLASAARLLLMRVAVSRLSKLLDHTTPRSEEAVLLAWRLENFVLGDLLSVSLSEVTLFVLGLFVILPLKGCDFALVGLGVGIYGLDAVWTVSTIRYPRVDGPNARSVAALWRNSLRLASRCQAFKVVLLAGGALWSSLIK